VGTESVIVGSAVSVPDTGTGIDSATVVANVGVADAGKGSDTVLIATGTVISLSETGTGTESLSLAISFGLSDSALGTDSEEALNAFDLSDAGAGSDSVLIATGTFIRLMDAGIGSDSVQVSVSLSFSDHGTGFDSPAALVVLAPGDAGIGTDSVSASAATLITLTDSGTATEAIQVGLVLPVFQSIYIGMIQGFGFKFKNIARSVGECPSNGRLKITGKQVWITLFNKSNNQPVFQNVAGVTLNFGSFVIALSPVPSAPGLFTGNFPALPPTGLETVTVNLTQGAPAAILVSAPFTIYVE
jgi:hypothetical protein